MRRVTNRDLQYVWRDANGALALPGDGSTGPAVGIGGLSFSREMAIPQLVGLSAFHEAEILSWSGGLRPSAHPKGALYIPHVEILGGTAYCSGSPPVSPNGATVDISIVTTGPAGTKLSFKWPGVIASVNGAITKILGYIGASDLGNYSFLRTRERTSMRLRVEFAAGAPANAILNPGVYRVVVFAHEI
jgi:hypothetical protein